jgi:hypothetical protein
MVFEDQVRSRPVESARDVLDAYMTAYFNAWLHNHNLYGHDKRWVIAFSPGLITGSEERDGFFTDYPDGRLSPSSASRNRGTHQRARSSPGATETSRRRWGFGGRRQQLR